MDKKIMAVVNKIVDYMNEVNMFLFTEEELQEGRENLIAQIEAKNIDDAITVLQEEYNCTQDIEAIELINKLKGII